MHWFFRYLIARESYRLINRNRGSIGRMLGCLFTGLVGLIFHGFMLALMVLLTRQFTDRHNLQPAQLQAGDSLFVHSQAADSLPLLRIYGYGLDTVLQYRSFDYRVDTLSPASFADNPYFVGTYAGQLLEVTGSRYPQIHLSPGVGRRLSPPANLRVKELASDTTYVRLQDVSLRGLPPPEQRWLRYFLALLFAYLLLIFLLQTGGRLYSRIRQHNRSVEQFEAAGGLSQAEASRLQGSKQALQQSAQADVGKLVIGLLALLGIALYVVYLHAS